MVEDLKNHYASYIRLLRPVKNTMASLASCLRVIFGFCSIVKSSA